MVDFLAVLFLAALFFVLEDLVAVSFLAADAFGAASVSSAVEDSITMEPWQTHSQLPSAQQ
ncbi:hypothetical protein LRY58_02250 [Candidatus Woesebacteria bacterium]|nr:hypothetical protein [Candidatus Woesebacteria bacterium]